MLKVPVDVGGGGGGGVIVDAAFADHVAHVGQEGPRSPSRTRPTGRTPSSMSWHEHPVRRGSTAGTPSRCTTGGCTNCRCLGQRPERVALRPWAGAAGGVGARCWLGTTPMLEVSVRAMSGGRTARDDEGGAARERRNAGVKLEEHG